MRILVATYDFPTLSQTFIVQHVAGLLDRGHEVWIVAEKGDDAFHHPLVKKHHMLDRLLRVPLPNGTRLQQLAQAVGAILASRQSVSLLAKSSKDWLTTGKRAGSFLLAALRVRAVVDNGPFDVVHAQFGGIGLAMAHLKRAGAFRCPLIVTFHGTDLNLRKKLPKREEFAVLFKQAGLCTVGTPFMADRLRDCGLTPSEYQVVPCGIDLQRFTATSPEKDPTTPFRLVTVGRLIACKGVEYAIRMLATLADRHPKAMLDIVGEGPLRSSLEKLAEELGVSRQVGFLGAQAPESVVRILGHSDIYLQPGIVADDGTCEGQGVVLAEAQAAGLPVVASRVGGIPFVVEDEKSAFLVEQKDVATMTQRVEQLIDNPALRQQMGQAGREYVAQNFDQEMLIDRWVEIYERLKRTSSQ